MLKRALKSFYFANRDKKFWRSKRKWNLYRLFLLLVWLIICFYCRGEMSTIKQGGVHLMLLKAGRQREFKVARLILNSDYHYYCLWWWTYSSEIILPICGTRMTVLTSPTPNGAVLHIKKTWGHGARITFSGCNGPRPPFPSPALAPPASLMPPLILLASLSPANRKSSHVMCWR